MFAFPQWYWVNPKPSGFSLNDIQFIDQNTGFIVGNRTMMKSMDGGETWEIVNQNQHYDLYYAWFCSPMIGYASSDTGTMYKTIDGGINWLQIETGTTEFINDICFIDQETGFFATDDGKLYKTTNGGDTWEIKISQDFWGLTSIAFPNPNRGIVTGYGGKYYITNDSGETWSPHELEYHPHLYHTSCLDENNWFVSGQFGFFMKTTDGGNSWVEIESNRMLGKIHFIDNLTGYGLQSSDYLFPEGKYFFKTTDGGQTWDSLSFDQFHSFYVKQDQHLILVGNAGRLFSTEDDCITMENHNSAVTHEDLIKINFPSADTGYSISYLRTMLKTVDKGENWQVLPMQDSLIRYSGLWFTDNNTGYVTSDSTVYKTVDGGNTWNEIFIAPGSFLTNITFVDKDMGFVTGDWDGSIYKTTDAGASWNVIYQAFNVRNIQFLDRDTGFIATSNSVIKTVDGGITWTEYIIDDQFLISDLYFINSHVGFICGKQYMYAYPIVYKTIDGGLTWNSFVITNTYAHPITLYFLDENRGFLSTEWNFYQTSNGGASWELLAYMPGSAYSIFFTDNHTGYLAGRDGLIMKTTNAGAVSVLSPEKPASHFTLYPNPVNRNLTLSSDKYNGNVRVTIFNSSGLLVFDENYNGTDINISTEDLNAGMYLVRISTQVTTEVQKLVKL